MAKETKAQRLQRLGDVKAAKLANGDSINKNDAINPHSEDYDNSDQGSGATNVHGEEDSNTEE